MIILLIVVLIIVAVNASQQPCPPPPEPNHPCPENANIIHNGSISNLTQCKPQGNHNGADYSLVYPGVKTYIPFRPTTIYGPYKTAIFIRADEVDTEIHTVMSPEIYIKLPPRWNEVHVILYR
jgi:hypothetical protein